MVIGNRKEEGRVSSALFLILLEKALREEICSNSELKKTSPSLDSNPACSDRMPQLYCLRHHLRQSGQTSIGLKLEVWYFCRKDFLRSYFFHGARFSQQRNTNLQSRRFVPELKMRKYSPNLSEEGLSEDNYFQQHTFLKRKMEKVLPGTYPGKQTHCSF